MATIRMQNISTSYCLKDINITIHDGEFMVILGHSGAGKSTLLNILAGFVGHSGDLYFDEKRMNQIVTQKREISYLHQAIHLFPHLDVFENIAFGLRVKGMSKGSLEKKVSEIMGTLHISHLKNRYPKNLSGGEKQRVGLARAIVTQPKILLLDEPLSSLDEATAHEIRTELKILQQKLHLSIIYVTHTIIDAKVLAHRVIGLNKGRIEYIGTPQEIFKN
ncbi:ABC transporter ATP-binding protein [Sulfurospirillum deleyianum]|uniref:ABC transporter related protein n=1 Tax=Sulfurospirillum deleyianum (strain ATCC 51133 / DSM 6946 / 5175) TaxID=525898 RepID=D1B3Q8_SULD5|nr:ABC transporter ATP-binding protein [Sulfurospirillum deleyianum]ACZ12728.1 ABC transporter related protein [Sulfurospirillum deleyianum DSM 6946]